MVNLNSHTSHTISSTRIHRKLITLILALATLQAPANARGEDIVPADALIELLGNPEPHQQRRTNKTTRGVNLQRGIAGIRNGDTNKSTGEQSTAASPQQSFNNILFDSNSAQLKSDSFQQLNEIGKALQLLMINDEYALFTIEGHTDSRGSVSHNQQLSLLRARAVRSYLMSNFSVDGSRLDTRGLGELQPTTDNDTVTNRSFNRRVVILRNY